MDILQASGHFQAKEVPNCVEEERSPDNKKETKWPSLTATSVSFSPSLLWLYKPEQDL